MNFYVVSKSENGKLEINGMYYLMNDQGQYMDSVIASSFEEAYKKLTSENKIKDYMRRYGKSCYFFKINDTNKSVYELRILNRVFKKRLYDRYGHAIPLPESEPPIVVKKKRRGKRWWRKIRTPEQQAIYDEKQRKFWIKWWRVHNFEATRNCKYYTKRENKQEKENGTISEVQTD